MSFDRGTQRLKPIHKGQKIKARQLSLMADSINRIHGGIRPPLQVVGLAARGANVMIARFVITEVAGDYLVCREFDGTQQGDQNVFVAKPPLLRNSLGSRASITYTYANVDERTADNSAETEDQVVVPSYAVDDEIYAVRGLVRGSGVLSDPGGTQKIEWLDLNLDARAWAAVEE